MEENKQGVSSVKILKIVLTVIAVVSFILVSYNIGVYTNDEGVEAFVEVE